MWYITSQKNGVSALGLQRVLGLGSYRTAWLMLHKLRQAMVRPGREKLSGEVEVDETYWGSAEFGGATGRKTLSKVLIIVAAEADDKRIGRIRMALIEDFDRKTLHRFIQDNIELGSMVCTDGLNSYRELNGSSLERVLLKTVHRLVHRPTLELRAAAAADDGELVDVLAGLFDAAPFASEPRLPTGPAYCGRAGHSSPAVPSAARRAATAGARRRAGRS